MRIVMLANFREPFTALSQARELEKQGCDLHRYDYRVLLNGRSAAERDELLVGEIRKVEPDFVLFHKCEGMDMSVAGAIDEYPRVYWYMDTHRNMTPQMQGLISQMDICFWASREMTDWGRRFGVESRLLPEGFDPEQDRPLKVPKKWDVSFIGALRPDRLKYLTDVHVETEAFGLEHAHVVSQTRVNLNLNEPFYGTSDRTYKVLAAGGFLLTQRWEGMEEDFAPGRHLVTFGTDPDDMRTVVQYYLDHDAEREKIANEGRLATQRFSKSAWAVRLLQYVRVNLI